MELTASRWAVGGGLNAEWRAVMRRRVDQALKDLAFARTAWRKAPSAARGAAFDRGLDYFLSRRGADRDRLAAHPCFDYWLYLFLKHFENPAAAHDWRLHYGIFQSFPATLAAQRGESVALEAALDPDGRFFFYGTPYYLEFEGGKAGERLDLRIARGGVTAVGPKRQKVEFSINHETPSAEAGPLRKLTEVRPGLVVDGVSWLTTHGITMHGLLKLSKQEQRSFAVPIKQALDDLQDREPALAAELTDLLRVVVPLRNERGYGSVSSSYTPLRGLIALSPSDDALLQAETLIHEFCHCKANQLLAVDPGLRPGQAGQVFYSPWRPDARRLRGLWLGAHAFLNVARYLARSLEREEYGAQRRIEVMVNVARRVEQVEDALRSVSMYGSFTPFGSQLLLEMWNQLGAVRHAIQWFPPALLEQQRAIHRQHRAEHALGTTGFHRDSGLQDRVRRPRFTATQ